MDNQENMQKMQGVTYKKFASILTISFIIMYCVKFLNADEANHSYLSTTRTYMALLTAQTRIGDVQYMKAMIPHHSSAIMVSKHPNIQEPEVKKLSEGIIAPQVKEIVEMKGILEKIGK